MSSGPLGSTIPWLLSMTSLTSKELQECRECSSVLLGMLSSSAATRGMREMGCLRRSPASLQPSPPTDTHVHFLRPQNTLSHGVFIPFQHYWSYWSGGHSQSTLGSEGHHKHASFSFCPFILSSTVSFANELHEGFQLSQQFFLTEDILTGDLQDWSLLAGRCTLDYHYPCYV